MLGSLILYIKGMRIPMFQLSGFYFKASVYAFGAVLLLTPTKFSSSTSEGRIWDFPKMGDPNIVP